MPSTVREKVPLAPYTTLGIGGVAEYFVDLEHISLFTDVAEWAREKKLPITILGGGSNVLIADEGIQGLVIHMRTTGVRVLHEDEDTVVIAAAAGESWDTLVNFAAESGYWGLENLSGIPGSVGAAPIQNINAYGISVGDSVSHVQAVNLLTLEEVSFSKEECAFQYRDSFFKSEKGREFLITTVNVVLQKRRGAVLKYRSSSQSIERLLSEEGITDPTPRDIRRGILHMRRNIGMLLGMYQSAGSFFKNVLLSQEEFTRLAEIVAAKYGEKSGILSPWHWEVEGGLYKVSTAFLMECTAYNKTDFKEKSFRGVVGISPGHTLSLVNQGSAHAADVRAFAKEIQETVHATFNILIEPEVLFLP